MISILICPLNWLKNEIEVKKKLLVKRYKTLNIFETNQQKNYYLSDLNWQKKSLKAK